MEEEGADRSVVVCAICLEEAGQKGGQGTGQLSGCSHVFCFPCILEWSKVTNSCPLCKQKFNRLIRTSAPTGDCAVQQVIKVKDRRQEHECDIRELQEMYGDNGAEDNSFIDDRSDDEIERDVDGGEDDDELGWLMGQRKEVDHETDTVIFSQDGRRLRNTRARRKRDATTRSQEQPGSQDRAQKRPRTAYQRTIAEVLQIRRTRLQPRRSPGEVQSSPQDEIILLDCESEESEKQKSDTSQNRPPSSQPLSGSGSSEQYTPTQILVRPNGAMPAWQTEVDGNRTITSYFPSSQETGCIRSALSPICLSPASSEESPPDCSLSSCFPLPRLLGRESSSQTTVSTQSQKQKKVSASQSSQRGSRRKASQTRSREMNKENRPNVQSLFFSLVSTQPPTCSQESSPGYPQRLEHSSPPTATPPTSSQSDPAFAVPQAPSVRSSASRVHTSSASSSSSSNLTASSASTSTSASSPSTLAAPSLLSQHHFQALSAVRAELMPFFKKNVVSLDEFKDIAKKVCEQYIVEERRDLTTKSLCLTPRRKQKIRHLVERELAQVDSAIGP